MSQPILKLLVLKTNETERLRDFYTRLGFEFVEEQHGNGPRHFTAAVGDGILEIYPLADGSSVDSTTRLGFAVSDIHGVVAWAREVTTVLTSPTQTEWGLRAVVRDPDGRTVELYHQP